MCDTLWARGRGGSIFAKNSDRPPAEVQVATAGRRRGRGGLLRTQYLTLDETGAAATILSRPTWLWGAEHGVNEHGVAIGNEEIYTTVDAAGAAPALIGMDLVRLGLERSKSAEGALEVMTDLLARYGQGGVANPYGEAYFSSFLVADAAQAWVLETAGTTWAARPVQAAGAISNRISIRADWVRASADVSSGDDFDMWRKPDEPTGHADRRLAASRALLAAHPEGPGPREVVAHLRDHGKGPWGLPGAGDQPAHVPLEIRDDFTGVTVCMHVRDFMATTSSMVVALPDDPEAPLRAWLALGSPCVSVFVPVIAPRGDGFVAALPGVLGDPEVWHRFEALARRAEREPESIEDIRAVLDPLEGELWDEADAFDRQPQDWAGLGLSIDRRVRAGLGRLGLR